MRSTASQEERSELVVRIMYVYREKNEKKVGSLIMPTMKVLRISSALMRNVFFRRITGGKREREQSREKNAERERESKRKTQKPRLVIGQYIDAIRFI